MRKKNSINGNKNINNKKKIITKTSEKIITKTSEKMITKTSSMK